jgi:vacuolar-type H+-ATPase catalytic subunit A/Vma1
VIRKTKADETINKYKAKLVAKGFKQQESVSYLDTYSTMLKTIFIRMLIINVATNILKYIKWM